MARPLRIDGEGFWYHVMARGDDGRVIFTDKREHGEFLKRLAQMALLFSVEIHAYALMQTHLHLFVRTPIANLGRFMQRLLTGHSVWYNRRHERTGHVFQGRYKALVVDRDAYGAEVSRYIHLNPARASASRDLAELRRVARSYAWSSYPAYLGLAPAPAFLHIADTLKRFGSEKIKARTAYAQFVEEGLLRDLPAPLDNAQAQSVLGNERFVERIRRMVVAHGDRDTSARCSAQRLTSVPIALVIEPVARAYHLSPQALCQAKRRRSEARRVLLWAAHTWCGGTMSLHQRGAMLGGVNGQAVGKAARLVAAERRCDARMHRNLAHLEQRLGVLPARADR